MPQVLKRVEAVKEQRLKSDRDTTKDLANSPTLFGEIRQPLSRYLAIPEVSSESRRFIPIGFLDADIIASNKLYTLAGAGLYEFGIITSTMHNAWMRTVSGKLKSDYQYSSGIVYNNFPWPTPTAEQKKTIETKSQEVLDARALYPKDTLADLYGAMPPELVKAHAALDKAVDAAYGYKQGKDDAARVAFLFEKYQQITSLLPLSPAKKTRKK